MFNCSKKPFPGALLPNNEIRNNRKPIVLSSQRYDKILSNANKADGVRAQKDAGEEQKYREYLKKGSDDLVANFKGNIQRSKDSKMAEVKERIVKQQMQDVQQSIDQYKENDERERREKIAKAQQLIDKLKPGPRELHTAALQSEVLRARNVQRNINEEFEKAIKKQECIDKRNCLQTGMAWFQEEIERQQDRQKRTNNYKSELLQTISDNSKQRAEHKRHLIKEQQSEREAMDQEIKAQIEKEKAVMEKKRAALRKNALEAMKMVEQRRLRERMTDEIEDRLNCVYNVGKRHLDALKTDQAKKIAEDRKKATEANVLYVASLQEQVKDNEVERIKRDISRMQLKFTAEEQEKIRKDKAAKQTRIEAYVRELQQQKDAKQRAEEQKRYEMALRFKNTEVNYLFKEAEQQERLRKVHALRGQLKEQAELKERTEKVEKETNIKDSQPTHEREDKFFFEYARNLMEDAQKKERPLYPFAKVVHQYKQDHQIDCERKVPKHLVSHIQMGIRQPGDSKAEAEQATKQVEDEAKAMVDKAKEKSKCDKTDRESILENCLKITELLVTSEKGNKKCDALCPTADITGLKKENDCVSLTPSAKLRYSMDELKKLNQFVAPSVH